MLSVTIKQKTIELLCLYFLFHVNKKKLMMLFLVYEKWIGYIPQYILNYKFHRYYLDLQNN